ncbi:MAG: hypothetical protein CR967_05345 [Proteobacteria bacterium]|nr:MAG: hypothetical protein CR967_05345 [Pseudomonadota bacterium]
MVFDLFYKGGFMFKTKKGLLILCLLLFLLLMMLCICSKVEGIYNEIMPQSSHVLITKKDSKVLINGTFSKDELASQTIDRFKMFNGKVERGDVDINENISQNDKWHDVMQNIVYYFSNNLEEGELSFINNKLDLKGSTLSQTSKDDILAILEKLKAQGVDVSSDFELLEPKTDKQKIKKDLYELLHSKTIEFKTGEAIVKEESYPLLDAISDKLSTFPEVGVVIEGHTDDVGEDELNQKLSEDRAMSIKEYFIQKGIDGARLSTLGFGEYRPAFPNSSAENRQRNRRVEFKVKGE